MGEFAHPWGWITNEESNEIIIFSNLVREDVGNRRYVARVTKDVIEKAKYLKIVKGIP